MDSNHNQMKLTVLHIIAAIILALICPALLMGSIMEWADNFSDIDLGTISGPTAQTLEGFSTTTLNTDGEVDITVEAGNRSNSQLTNTTGAAPYNTLTTKYKIEFDGYAGDYTTFTDYSTFLSTPATVAHPQDNSIEIKLSAQVSTVLYEVPDKGSYSATQTLTASWAGL